MISINTANDDKPSSNKQS